MPSEGLKKNKKFCISVTNSVGSRERFEMFHFITTQAYDSAPSSVLISVAFK